MKGSNFDNTLDKSKAPPWVRKLKTINEMLYKYLWVNISLNDENLAMNSVPTR